MAGLLQGGAPLPEPMSNPSIVEGSQSAMGDATNVTPEEQENYDKLVTAAKELIYDERGQAGVMNSLERAESVAAGVGEATAFVIQQLDDASGGKVPEEIIMPAAMEIMADIAEMAEAAGMMGFTDGELMEATQATISAVAQAYGATPEDIQEMMEAYADDSGVMDTLEQMFQRAGAPVEPAQRATSPRLAGGE